MEIAFESERGVPFGSLGIGDTFEYRGCFYMVIQPACFGCNGKVCNAVNLGTGYIGKFGDDVEVREVDCRITAKYV